jgi:hypothetical protein
MSRRPTLFPRLMLYPECEPMAVDYGVEKLRARRGFPHGEFTLPRRGDVNRPRSTKGPTLMHGIRQWVMGGAFVQKNTFLQQPRCGHVGIVFFHIL